MTGTALPAATEWTPDWWNGPHPLILVKPDAWPEDTPPRGRSVVIEESGEEVPLGSFLFRFRARGSGSLVFCRDTEADIDSAERNRLGYTPAKHWQRGPSRKKAARKKAARRSAP